MLRTMIANDLLSGGTFGSRALEWIDVASLLIEILAVAVILVAIFYAGGRCLLQAAVAAQIENFVKFPPRQKPASFNLDAVLRDLEAASGGANH